MSELQNPIYSHEKQRLANLKVIKEMESQIKPKKKKSLYGGDSHGSLGGSRH